MVTVNVFYSVFAWGLPGIAAVWKIGVDNMKGSIYKIKANLSPTLGDVAQMVERPLSMREVRRSMRLFSTSVFSGFCFASQDLLPTRYARHYQREKHTLQLCRQVGYTQWHL